MRQFVRLVLAGLLFAALGLGCGKDRTGSHIPTTTEEPKTKPIMPNGTEGTGSPTTLVPTK